MKYFERHQFQSVAQTSSAAPSEDKGTSLMYANTTCFHCEKRGHPISRCPELNPKCFSCGNDRHVSGRCPAKLSGIPAPELAHSAPVFMSLSSQPPDVMVHELF